MNDSDFARYKVFRDYFKSKIVYLRCNINHQANKIELDMDDLNMFIRDIYDFMRHNLYLGLPGHNYNKEIIRKIKEVNDGYKEA